MLSKLISGVLLCVLGLFALPATAHDYHANITDVKYNPRTHNLEVAVRVFMDDLEQLLTRRAKTKVVYSSTSEAIKKQLSDYLSTALTFELEKGKPLKTRLLGSEGEDADVVWLYLEVPLEQASFSQLYVKNAILTDVFTDQMNIVNVNYKGSTESALMQRGDVQKKMTF